MGISVESDAVPAERADISAMITPAVGIPISKGQLSDIIELSRQDEMFEMPMMALRMKKGMSLSLFRERFAADFETIYSATASKNIANGMLQVKGRSCSYNGRGVCCCSMMYLLIFIGGNVMKEAERNENTLSSASDLTL